MRPASSPQASSYAEQSPDLRELATQYPALLPYLRQPRGANGPAVLQWDSYEGTRELTRALLHRDFGVDW